MINKLENWLLNVLAGKILARAAVTIAAYLATAPAQALLKSLGISVVIDQADLAAGLIALFHAAFEWFKARRMVNPLSPAVQTNPALVPPP